MNIVFGSYKNQNRIHNNKMVEFKLPDYVIEKFTEFKDYLFRLNITSFNDSIRNGIYRSVCSGNNANIYLTINGFFDRGLADGLKHWYNGINIYGIGPTIVSDMKVEISNEKFMIGWSYIIHPLIFSNNPIFISDFKNSEKNVIFYYGRIRCGGRAVQIE